MAAKAQQIVYATGRRKTSIARVYMKPGAGKIEVNGKGFEAYFPRPTSRMIIDQVIKLLDLDGKFDVSVKVTGGGLSGQAGAVRLGISRALMVFDSSYRAVLRSTGMLTRDSRMVERKKYGMSGARKRYQFSKR